MKHKLVVALCLFVLASSATAEDRAPLVHLEIWGAPWDTKFDVAIRTDAFLTVVATENGKSTTTRVKLSSSEMSSLQEIAAKAVIEKRITDCEKVLDGTNGRLSVLVGARVESRECFNTNRWPPAGSVGQKLLKKINAKLPKRTQVF